MRKSLDREGKEELNEFNKKCSSFITDEISKKVDDASKAYLSIEKMNSLCTKRLLAYFKKRFSIKSDPCIHEDWDDAGIGSSCSSCSLFPQKIAWQNARANAKKILAERENIS